MSYHPIPVDKRFWKFVHISNTDNCWEWVGTKRSGYGRISVNGRLVNASHVSWELHFGMIPDGLFVLHKCDNPSCVNPQHLMLGTQRDNMLDCSYKGRIKCGNRLGENNPSSKLTETDIKNIRIDNRLQKDIAIHYGVSRATICNVKSNKKWKYLTGV